MARSTKKGPFVDGFLKNPRGRHEFAHTRRRCCAPYRGVQRLPNLKYGLTIAAQRQEAIPVYITENLVGRC